MSLQSRWTTSWTIFKASLNVIAREKKLLVFPVVIACFTLVIAALFIAPAVLQPTGYHLTDAAHWQAIASRFTESSAVSPGTGERVTLNNRGVAYLGMAYFLAMFFATFFNVAFFSEIIRALHGEAVSIRRGLHFAAQRWQGILCWSLLAGIVGFLIRMISERLGWVGRIIVSLIGLAWSVAAVFAIPVLVMEQDQNPLTVLKKSADTIKKTWGESLIGYLGIQLASVILVISATIIGLTIAMSALIHSPIMLVAGGIVWLGAILGFNYVASVASRVFQCGLYLYASEGFIPAPFDQDMMNTAWKTKTA